MDTKTRNALEALDTTARQIAELFVKKYYDYDLEVDYVYAVADDPTGAWGVGDEFWNFDDMVTALRHNADRETLMDWYYKIYTAEHDDSVPFISLKLWLKGMRPKDLERY
jgi:hypothetical protein|nr:MAG TPA: hypothetical protein [Caudoviricetes sp.]